MPLTTRGYAICGCGLSVLFVAGCMALLSCLPYTVEYNEYAYAEKEYGWGRISVGSFPTREVHRDLHAYGVSPYRFDIYIDIRKDATASVQLDYVQFRDEDTGSLVLELRNAPAGTVFRKLEPGSFCIDRTALDYSNYTMVLAFSYDNGGSTEREEARLALRKKPVKKKERLLERLLPK